jgi:hypothetical protein
VNGTKRVPTQYRKQGRPAWRHDAPDHEPRGGTAHQRDPAPKVAPLWWAGFGRGVRLTRWDKRRDAVGATLAECTAVPPYKPGEKRLIAVRQWERPTRTTQEG